MMRNSTAIARLAVAAALSTTLAVTASTGCIEDPADTAATDATTGELSTAISVVASATGNKTTTGGASASVARPSAVQAGDLLLASITVSDGLATLTPPAGWTVLGKPSSIGSGPSLQFAVYWRFAGSETGPYTFNSGVARSIQLGLVAIRGAAAIAAPRIRRRWCSGTTSARTT